MSNAIVFERQHHIGVITLARPEALNAIDLPMIKALQQQLQQWQDDGDIHAVVVQASPGKAFCAGGDVRWLYERGLQNDPEQLQFFWHEYHLNYFIHQFKKPYIALMDGITMGGGVGISLHGSHPVAGSRFVFSMPETGIGLFPDIGASYLLSRCPGHVGLYLALTGNRLGAEDARAMKLVKYTVDTENFAEILPSLHKLNLSQNAALQVSAYLKSVACEKEAPIQQDLEKINHYFSRRSLKDIMSGLETSDDAWAATTFTNLQQKSPLSLAVTFEQMHKAKSLSLAECLKLDYCLVGHFMAGKDFYEGIRALLIDKDKNPRWQPSILKNVTNADIANYFECEESFLM
ncbi:MAG: enoyl-CoA hydratase/isomerase family protein [Legionella sp.]|nr:enoyl-CoA hydratase/isomerase family protein [Legionella sp.]